MLSTRARNLLIALPLAAIALLLFFATLLGWLA